jgi:hypothetical protein
MLVLALLTVTSASIVEEIEKRTLPKYKFRLVDGLVEAANFSVETSDTSGYKCRLPDGSQRTPAARLITDEEINAVLAAHAHTKHILDRGEWWTYELEIGRGFRQLHFDRPGLVQMEIDPVPTTISLGRWNSTSLWSNKVPTFRSNQSFTVMLYDGDLCGPGGIVRETALESYCHDHKMPSYLIDIHEISTCKYKVKMHMAELCAAEDLEDAVINCFYSAA